MEHTRGRRRKGALAVCAGAGLLTGLAKADVTYVDFYTLGKPASFTSASPAALPFKPVAAGGQTVGSGDKSGTTRAVVWSTANHSGADLTPGSFSQAQAYGTSGVLQVGSGSGSSTGNNLHALVWNGSFISFTDLNPTSGFTTSEAYGLGGGQIVGYGSGSATGGSNHALVWNGTASTDLHPGAAYSLSKAYGANGTSQVGYAVSLTDGNSHAMLWSNSAAGAIDLNPDSSTGYVSSNAYGVGGTKQVGNAAGPATGFANHAFLWSGSSGSFIDLNPSSFASSSALTTDGTQQVGLGYLSGDSAHPHALYWSGSPDSVIDLNAILPSATFVSSEAFAINGQAVFGYATDTGGAIHVIEWVVPEPSAILLLPAAAMLRRRRRK